MAEAAPGGDGGGGGSVPQPMDSGGAECAAGSEKSTRPKLPTCVIVLGMAGSGKTTWMQRLNASLHMKVHIFSTVCDRDDDFRLLYVKIEPIFIVSTEKTSLCHESGSCSPGSALSGEY